MILQGSSDYSLFKLGGCRSSEDGALSEEFQTPVAVAVHLLDPAVSATPMTPAESETKETEVKEELQGSQDTGANVSQILGNFWRGFDRRNLPGGISDRRHRRPLLPRPRHLRRGRGVYWDSLGHIRTHYHTFLQKRALP